MGTTTDDVSRRGATLAQALKGIRRRRGLRPAEVADALGIAPRSYEHFESGRGRLNVDRVRRVAEILDADPVAILIALEIGSPAFAVRCADNKLATLLTMALETFDAAAKDDIARLDTMTLYSAFSRMFGELAIHAREQDALVERWKTEKGRPGPDPEDG